MSDYVLTFFFQAEDGIRDGTVTGVQTCALPISSKCSRWRTTSRPATCTACLEVVRLREHFDERLVGVRRDLEIGRASCREREWIAVVAGSSTEKERNQALQFSTVGSLPAAERER